jgi:hypothetical protein
MRNQFAHTSGRRLQFIHTQAVKSMVALIGAVLFLPILGWSAGGTAKAGLIFNEDESHFFGSRSAEEMTLEGLHASIDQYANTAVSELFLCPNAMKASYRSKVRDAIWELKDGQKPPREDFAKKWCENARLLDARGWTHTRCGSPVAGKR